MKSTIDIDRSAGAMDRMLLSDTRRDRRTKLTELLRLVPLQTVVGRRDLEIAGVSLDSREVESGFVFVAIEGATADGHDFLDDAVSRGAVAIVSERAPQRTDRTWIQTPDARRAAGLLAAAVFENPARKLDLVGITGTNGKTTQAFLMDGLLTRLAPPSVMLGTVVAKLDDRNWPTRHTTPEAPTIQALLAEAVDVGARFGALEVSSHGLALGRLEGCEFETVVFTNLSRDHLDFHRDMEDYFEAKRLLFTRYRRPSGTAIVSIDDTYGERLAAELSGKVLTYGLSETADLSITDVESTLGGILVRFRERGQAFELRSPLLGRYNASNLLGVFAAARTLGFSSRDVLRLLSQVPGAPGRFERVDVGAPFDVIVDYAHTDDALRKLLEAARPLAKGKLWVVFGCGGERDRTKRPLMGDVAARLADRVVITSDNPRGEDPLAIVREIQLGAKGKAVAAEADRRKAIGLAMSEAEEGDLIVIAGKGHEPYQIVGEQVLAFDDREVVRELAGSERDEGPDS